MSGEERQALRVCLESSPALVRYCRQNGWIDNDTLRFEITAQDGEEVEVAVYFDEVIMEGAGCIAGRLPGYGRVRLRRVRQDGVTRFEPVQ